MIPVMNQSRRVIRPVSAAFSPLDIPGCVLWLKACSLALSDGAPVSTWGDLSGNGNDAMQQAESKQPSLSVGVINGKPVVRFDGTSDSMVVPVGVSTKSLFLAIRKRSSPTGNSGAITFSPTATIFTNQSYGTSFCWYDAIGYSGNVAACGGNATDFQILSMLIGSSLSIRRNGNIEVETSTPASLSSSTSFTLCDYYGGYSDCDVAEIIGYDSVLADSASVESYLNSKYAIY